MMVQFAPAATELPQLFVWMKSAGLAPLIEILVMLKEELAALVRVTFCGLLVTRKDWLGNVSDEGDRLTVGDEVPVPVSEAGMGAIADVNVTLTVAERVPAADGVKETVIAQEEPAAMLPHALV